MLGKYDKNKANIYKLVTECIEYIKYIGCIGDASDILYIQETHLL